MTAKVDWDADQYLRFEDERTRPSLDLLQGVRLTAPARCIDLGCGPGNSTELVAARFPDAEVTGLDSSADMIEKARKRLPRLSFVQADLAGWAPEERYDLIFANAVLQWLPDHEALFARLAAALKPGGVLVCSVEHPLMTAPARQEWLIDADGRAAWPVNGYSREGERRTNWFADGVLKHHRTIATTINTLIGAGFVLRRIEEFAPTPEQILDMPALAEEMERPMMLLVSARKPG